MRRRWYWIVGGVLMVLPMLLLPVVSVGVSQPGGAATVMRWLGPSIHVAVVLLLVGAAWFFWLCPWLEAGNEQALWPRGPEGRHRELKLIPWFPAGACVGLAICFVLANVWDRVTVGRWTWREHLLSPACLAVPLLALLLPWTWWLSRQVTRRFQATVARRGTCWRCGYDLRGNPDATMCPECGEATATDVGGVENGGAGR